MAETPTPQFPSNVLVVDDEKSVGDLLEAVGRMRGLTVRVASTGEEGLTFLEREAFGCALIDKNLPGVDGFAVMRQVRELQPHCAVIMMTGYSTKEAAVEALRLGASDYLEKPFEDVRLVGEKIGAAMRHKQAEYERNILVERLRTFQAELEEKDLQVLSQQTSMEMFNQLLEQRVKEATADYRKSLGIVASGKPPGGGVDPTIVRHAESLVEEAKKIHISDNIPSGQARAIFTRLLRRLEAHLALVHSRAKQ